MIRFYTLFLTLAAVAVLAGPIRAQDGAEERIRPGTVLEIYAIGVPEFRYEVRVGASGEASLPLLSPLVVTDMTLAELRAHVKAELPTRVYRQRTGDGLDALISIMPEEIVVEIAEHPPVYVTGDVTSPGEVAYRPNMTVREAVALAGGFDPVRSRTFDPFMEAADIRGDQMDAWIEHANLQVRRLGIEALLDESPLNDVRERVVATLPAWIIDEIVEVEIARLRMLERDDEDEKTHVDTLIADARLELADLEAEQVLVRERLVEQEAATEQFREGVQRGVVVGSRYLEEQRHLSYLQERALALSSRASAVRRDIHELHRRIEARATQRRIALLADFNETGVRLTALDARIEALQEKLDYVGNAGIGTSSSSGLRITFTLHRRTDAGIDLHQVGESDVLRSGDVLEVMLQRPLPFGRSRTTF